MKDKKTILKLYEVFMDEIYKVSYEEEQKQKKVEVLEDRLWKTLNKEQKKLYDMIISCESCKAEEINKQTFVYAFSLATQIFVEGLEKK